MAKLRINGDSSGYVDLEAPNAASSSTLDLDQVPQKNVANTFTTHQVIRTDTASGGYTAYPSLTLRNDNVNGYSVLHFNRGATTQSARIEVDNNNGSPTIGMYATSAGNGIKVDHNGVVTKPQQPGFHASNNTTPSGSTFTSGENTILKFDNVNSNVGGGWNTSTYRYTAPITGRYMIYAQARFDGLTSYARVYVSVNGSNSGYWGTGLHAISTQSPPSGGTMFTGSVQGVLPLSAGDYIELKGGSNNSVGTHQGEGSFGAYLLG